MGRFRIDNDGFVRIELELSVEKIEGDGMTPMDVSYYVKTGSMKLIEPTEEEFQKGAAAWYQRNGRDNPLEAKAKFEKARDELKAKGVTGVSKLRKAELIEKLRDVA